MNKHTPGPWEIFEGTIVGADNSPICSLYDADDFPCLDDEGDEGDAEALQLEFDANAHLIAAAPELLEIVQTLVQYGGGMEYDDYRMLCQRGEAAIAKATGEIRERKE